jgi:hypothetical protein
LLAAPATASAHGYYNWWQPGATAPDGHSVVSISWTVPPLVPGYASGQAFGVFTCLWSDGTSDHCEGLAEWF